MNCGLLGKLAGQGDFVAIEAARWGPLAVDEGAVLDGVEANGLDRGAGFRGEGDLYGPAGDGVGIVGFRDDDCVAGAQISHGLVVHPVSLEFDVEGVISELDCL